MTKYPKKFEPKKVQGTNFYRTEVSKTKLFVSFILPFEFKKKKKKTLVRIHFIVHLYRSKDNEQMFMTYTLRSFSASPVALNLAPVEDEIVSISVIPTMSIKSQFYPISTFIYMLFNFSPALYCCWFISSLLKTTYHCQTAFNHTTCLCAQTVIILFKLKQKERWSVSIVPCKAC